MCVFIGCDNIKPFEPLKLTYILNQIKIINMMDLFSTPIKSKKVRVGVYAYLYQNGTINIDGRKYIGYSMTEAIRLFRQSN